MVEEASPVGGAAEPVAQVSTSLPVPTPVPVPVPAPMAVPVPVAVAGPGPGLVAGAGAGADESQGAGTGQGEGRQSVGGPLSEETSVGSPLEAGGVQGGGGVPLSLSGESVVPG